MSRINRLEIENFKKISFVAMDIDGRVTEISGCNGAGKSTALDAVSVLLDGMAVSPAEPIRHGQTKAVIRGRFGEMTVIRTIVPTADGKHTSRIQFQPPGEKPSPATQTQLDKLIGEHNLDPLDFLNLNEEQRFAALQAFVPGVDFAKSARADAADNDERKEVNRDAKRSRAAADLILVPEGTPSKPVDEGAVIDQLTQAGKHNADIETAKSDRQREAQQIARFRAAADALIAAIPEAVAKVKAQNDALASGLTRRIAELEDQLVDLREQLANTQSLGVRTAENEEARLRGEADEHTGRADRMQAALEALKPVAEPIDIAALRAKIDAARVTNEAVARAKERAEHVAAAEHLEAKSAALTEAMEARRAAREEAVSKAAIPVKGLEFGDGEIRLHGAPWKQASTGQKLRAAFEYCVGKNPTLRLIWIRDASVLDDAAFAEVNRLAVEFDCTVLLETVRPIGGNSVVLEDGKVREVHKASTEEAAA